jgi:alpha-tubulin suppressor-like RCC1 family protein
MFIKNGSFKKYTHIISYVPPTIIIQPRGDIKNVGSDYTFTISARGSRPLTYQWYKNDNPILTETSNQLILTNLQISDDGSYFCEVRNNGYLLESDIVDLAVVDSLSFSQQPTSLSANSNSNVSFSVVVDSDTSVNYQWYKNSLIYPGTSNTLYINYVTENEEGTYFCVASNLLAAITSNSATLKVNDPIIINDHPDDTLLNVGDNLTLSISCVGTFPISAQWRKNNTNYGSLSVRNDGDIKLQITNVQNTDEGNYDCVLSNIVGSVTSNKALFYINKPPQFILNPIDGIGYDETSFTFTSNASGTNPISYQWIKENEGLISQATFKDYKLTNLQFSNSGKYACIASNLYESVTSTFASLSVLSSATIIDSKIKGGNRQSLFLGNNGTISGCGLFNSKTIPTTIQLPPVKSFSVKEHTLFLGNDNTLSAVGINTYGQLGDGTNSTASIPIKIDTFPIKMVAAGYDHSLFLGTDGTVSACGNNGYGQLGNGTLTDQYNLTKVVNISYVKMIAAGNDYSLFLGMDGRLSGCGVNTKGQLGFRELMPGALYSFISEYKYPKSNDYYNNVAAIYAGKQHSLILCKDRSVFSFGSNEFGQLGTVGTLIWYYSLPLPPVKMIAVGENHTLFLGMDGTVSGCGYNQYGQLGNNTTTNVNTPILINLPPVSTISAGDNHSLFLGMDGTLSACGRNNVGQLGDGTKINKLTPVKINLPLIF